MASSAAEGASASGQDALPGMEQFFAKLFNSSEDSDLIIRCGGKQWDVHRHIVCPRSKYFDRACAGGFEVRLPAIYCSVAINADHICRNLILGSSISKTMTL